MITPRNIVVATDFGDAASRAFSYGLEYARAFGARLHVVHVVNNLAAAALPEMGMPPIDFRSAQATVDEEARQTLGSLLTAEAVQTLDVRPVLLRDHQTGRSLLEFASQIEADLIIIGTHGRGGLAEFFLGSSAQKVVRSAACPVLTVRATERDYVRPDSTASAAGTQLP